MMPSTKIAQKWSCSTKQGDARPQDKKCLLMTCSPEPLVQIQNYLSELFLIMPFTEIAQMFSLL